jgi:hypothetical protein
MTPAEADLYDRIKKFPLDVPGIEIPFSVKLAWEYRWSQVYIIRAIQEYKKFIFLAMVANHIVSPSTIIDRVWHHHLLYTHSYWDDFCGKVLSKSLHHSPGSGSKEDIIKNHHFYELTLATYRKYFGTPPDDIWDYPPMRSQNPSYQWIDRDLYWLIPNPLYWFKQSTQTLGNLFKLKRIICRRLR